MVGPLEGIRVIDWTIYQLGPVATMWLGDMGAEIIKIEDRRGGDPSRGVMKSWGQHMSLPQGRNFYFECNNRNKKSLAVDLTKPEGLEIVHNLVSKSDVFVQNFRKGVASKLGLDYEALSRQNPRIIYATATGYGPKGPDSDKPVLDTVATARSGLMQSLALPGGEPVYYSGALGDQLGGMVLAYAITLAITARERLGIGQHVDISHLASLMWLQGLSLHAQLMLGKAPAAFDRRKARNPIFNYYRCKEDEWLFLGCSQADRHWPDICSALGIENLRDDLRFADAASRDEHCEELICILDNIMAKKSSRDWLAIFSRYRDLIYSTVNHIADLPDDPQVRANDYVVTYDHPAFGPTQMLGFPVNMSRTPGSIRMPAPELGEHTEEILLDVCGYNWNDIAALKDKSVI